MLTQRIFACGAVLIPAVILGGLSLTAQDLPPAQQVFQNPPRTQSGLQIQRGYRGTNNSTTALAWTNVNETEVGKALNAFRKAETDDAKDGAKSELRDALAAEYEDRMNQYDAHIESLEKELEAMRERLSRRRKAKDDMVSLKMKEMIANADGLGWPSGPNRTPSSRLTFPRQSTSPFGSPPSLSPNFPVPQRIADDAFEQIN